MKIWPNLIDQVVVPTSITVWKTQCAIPGFRLQWKISFNCCCMLITSFPCKYDIIRESTYCHVLFCIVRLITINLVNTKIGTWLAAPIDPLKFFSPLRVFLPVYPIFRLLVPFSKTKKKELFSFYHLQEEFNASWMKLSLTILLQSNKGEKTDMKCKYQTLIL